MLRIRSNRRRSHAFITTSCVAFFALPLLFAPSLANVAAVAADPEPALDSPEGDIAWRFGCEGDTCTGDGRIVRFADGRLEAVVTVENEWVLDRDGTAETTRTRDAFAVTLDEVLEHPLLGVPLSLHALGGTDDDGRRLHQLRGPYGEPFTELAFAGTCDAMEVTFHESSELPESSRVSRSTWTFDARAFGGSCDEAARPAFFGGIWAAYKRLCAKTYQAQLDQCATSCQTVCAEQGVQDSEYVGGDCGTSGRCSCSCRRKSAEVDPDAPSEIGLDP